MYLSLDFVSVYSSISYSLSLIHDSVYSSINYSLELVEGDGGVCGGEGLPVDDSGLLEPLVGLRERQHPAIALGVTELTEVSELFPQVEGPGRACRWEWEVMPSTTDVGLNVLYTW